MRHKSANSLATVFCLGLLKAAPSLGVDYALQASASLKQIYNSNLLLQSPSANKGTVFGSDLEVNTQFSAAAPTWSAKGGARFENWFYYGPGADFNNQNQYIDSQYSYRTGRSTWDLAGSYINAFLFASLADATTPQGVIVGLIGKESRSLSPSWGYSLTEYTRLNLSYQYYDSTFVTTTTTQRGFPDSHSHTASASASHQLSEYLYLNESFSFSRFMTSTLTIDYSTLMTGFKYAPYPSLSITANGGGQYTETATTGFGVGQLVTRTNNQLSPVFNLSANKKFENSNVAISYGRTISPTINALLFTSDNVSLIASRKFSQRLDGNLTASFISSSFPVQTGTLGLQGTTQQQDLFRFGGSLSYSLTQHAVISASYNYVFRELGSSTFNYSGAANTVSLNLRYNFDPLHF